MRIELHETCLNLTEKESWQLVTLNLFSVISTHNIKSYRPISIFTSYYKQYTQIITKRSEKELPKIKKREDQCGFEKGLFTGQNIRFVQVPNLPL